MRIPRRHRTALAVAALGASVGLTPLQSASAKPAAPAITVSMAQGIDMWGPAGDMDITVTAPPASDSYVRLQLSGNGPDNLHFTDDAGNTLPYMSHRGSDYVLVGTDDSDHNGVKGAPLTAGVIHIHVSASYPAYNNILVSAYLMDGATDTVIAHSSLGTNTELHVGQPYPPGLRPGAVCPRAGPSGLRTVRSSPSPPTSPSPAGPRPSPPAAGMPNWSPVTAGVVRRAAPRRRPGR